MSRVTYLDSAASAPVKFFNKDYYLLGNPNSVHGLGKRANDALKEAENKVKNCLGVKGGRVLFCRSASEAFKGLYDMLMSYGYGEDGWLFCSPYEHESVSKHTHCLESDVYVEHEDCDYDLRRDDFYFHQFMNNITGQIFDIEKIGKMVKSKGAFFGSDFTSAIGHTKLPENLEEFCDAVWLSGHKIGCEVGTGFMWLGDELVEFFGEDVDKLYPGTPNVAGARALAEAMEYAIDYYNRYKMDNQYSKLYMYMEERLVANGIKFKTVEFPGLYTYAINAITLPGIVADALVQFLSSRDIYISAGHSACSSDSEDSTRVLEAFGLSKEEASQTVRVSFNPDNDVRDIDKLVEGIVDFKKMFC